MTTTTSQNAARLQHLWEASHALATTAPAVSAHLMSRYQLLSAEDLSTSAASRRGVACPFCGTIRNPGSATDTAERRTRRDQETNVDGDDGTYTCPACKKITADDADIPSPPKRSKIAFSSTSTSATTATTATTTAAIISSATTVLPTTSTSTSIPTEANTPPISNSKTSSKTKGKSRKGGKASLSKMLAAQKQQGNNGNGGVRGGFGLDLMDLLKTA
ncbi:hypothetical protein BZA05DRAFT_385696 [Tricharina praecox]|uniref:uncharacterized protein n=1 Tax=Tricharina praecox TaxID=43433 RepID=UPI00221F3116|nr:uncharacterized protein BZA05DRAFT_385696 [Tricharina praecox]KAI5858039.1 hypothetical protein BZA05DRAFT_385696 [Tricharina praecox]